MKQFIEIEIESSRYNGESTTKIVVNVNHIITIIGNKLYLSAIQPVAHGTGQVICSLSCKESERIKELLLNMD